MKVSQLIEALQRCDPDRRVVVHEGPVGFEEITTVIQEDIGGLGLRMSYEMVRVVRLCQSSPGYLKKKGYNVVAEIPCEFDRGFDYVDKIRG